jgi:hypothetical protein
MRRAPTQRPYLLVGLGDDDVRKDMLHSVRARVRDLVRLDTIAELPRLPDFEDDPAVTAPYTLVVACVTTQDSLAPAERADINLALEAGIPVLPLTGRGFAASALPKPLNAINALSWSDERDVSVAAVLRLLGLIEEDRRVFLSYKRGDSDGVADQLRYGLQDRGFDVFLDRYSVPPGDDFQRRLDVELSDKAFVVLLESEDIGDSEWVRHEVTFALRQQISLVTLTLPWVPAARRLAAVPDDFRVTLNVSDLVRAHLRRQRKLTASALDQVLWRLEWEHARRLRRHREQLIETLSDWLRQSGHDVAAIPGWALAATGGGHDGIYLITPRAPTTADLRRADEIRQRVAQEAPAVVAHNPEWLDAQARDLNTWVAQGRGLKTEHHAGLRLTMGAR